MKNHISLSQVQSLLNIWLKEATITIGKADIHTHVQLASLMLWRAGTHPISGSSPDNTFHISGISHYISLLAIIFVP